MRIKFWIILLIFIAAAGLIPHEAAGQTGMADGVKYGVGNWKTYINNKKFIGLGNHRAVVEVAKNSQAVIVHIPWRRRDDQPENKDIVIVFARNGLKVKNRHVININREYGDIIFKPESGAGKYYIYYFPYMDPKKLRGKGFKHEEDFPSIVYLLPEKTENEQWIKKYSSDMQNLPKARLVEIQARTEFDSFYPMEIIATREETENLQKKFPAKSFLLFPENRKFPIRMTEDLPYRWIESGSSLKFEGEACRNEYYAFQIGVYALKPISNIQASFSDLVNEGGKKINSSSLTCFNNGGIDWLGREFVKIVDVPAKQIQALWFGLDVPADIIPGIYKGKVTISGKNNNPQDVELSITIKDEHLADRGDSEIWRHSRLRWLNSREGLNDGLVAPFTTVEYQGRRISILGRTIDLNNQGMPVSIKSFIDMEDINEQGHEILASPINFNATVDSKPVLFKSDDFKLINQAPGKIDLKAKGTWQKGTWQTDVSSEMDGYMRYRITIKADEDISLNGAKLEIPFVPEIARYIKLIRGRGGYRKKPKQEAPLSIGLFYNIAWMGDYNAGIACRPKNDEDEWNGDNKTKKDFPIAEIWNNNGTGRFRIEEKQDVVYMSLDSGNHKLKKGEEIRFNFALFITPFKPIRSEHWDYRYYHILHGKTPKLQKAVQGNARYINAHHGSIQNPNINYPFLNVEELRKTTEAANQVNIGQKIYYTVRELSVYAPEIWALRSLGDEVFMPGEGYRELCGKQLEYQKPHSSRTGFTWTCEHLVSNYINRWHTFVDGNKNNYDAAISVQGLSRWHNYYIEGLKWLAVNTGISGLYLDGIGYDRSIIKRIRKALLQNNPESLMDYHGQRLVPIMEQMPYLDSVWIGEGANYNLDEGYWLVEVSGIPFGLTGETLKPSASPYRAMLYGMARRYGWINGDPTNIWKWWDEFGIKESRTLGFWSDECPVKTGHPNIKATAYVKKGKSAAIAVASWAKNETQVRLDIDWNALGLEANTVKVSMPKINKFQEGLPSVSLSDAINIKPKKGFIIVIKK